MRPLSFLSLSSCLINANWTYLLFSSPNFRGKAQKHKRDRSKAEVCDSLKYQVSLNKETTVFSKRQRHIGEPKVEPSTLIPRFQVLKQKTQKITKRYQFVFPIEEDKFLHTLANNSDIPKGINKRVRHSLRHWLEVNETQTQTENPNNRRYQREDKKGRCPSFNRRRNEALGGKQQRRSCF
jgi:hypothetical protein